MVSEGIKDEDQKLQQRVASDYRAIIAILAGNGRRKLQYWLQEDSDSAKRLSLSEQVFEKVITGYEKDILWFTGRNLLRVYPKAIRVDSSNFNPLNAWIHGAQMVALNMQVCH